MTVVLASASALAAPQVTFVALLACLILLSVRIWRAVMNYEVPRGLSVTIDVAIVSLIAIYFLLVVIRFKILA